MIEFDIQSMTCGHCVSMVTKAVKSVDANAAVQVDLAAHKVRVETTCDRQTVAAALQEAGYAPA